MSYDVGLAKEFKIRDNVIPDEPTTGMVTSIEPLEISIFDGKAKLNSNSVRLSNDFCIITGTCEVNGINGTCTIDRTLKVGEEVKCIPTSGGQIWFIMR